MRFLIHIHNKVIPILLGSASIFSQPSKGILLLKQHAKNHHTINLRVVPSISLQYQVIVNLAATEMWPMKILLWGTSMLLSVSRHNKASCRDFVICHPMMLLTS